jgi:hypothetical protein
MVTSTPSKIQHPKEAVGSFHGVLLARSHSMAKKKAAKKKVAKKKVAKKKVAKKKLKLSCVYLLNSIKYNT